MTDGKTTGTASKAGGTAGKATPSKASATKTTTRKAAATSKATATKGAAATGATTKVGATKAAATKPVGTAVKPPAGKAAEGRAADDQTAVSKPSSSDKPARSDNEATDIRNLLLFIEAQTESVKKSDPEEVSLLKLRRAAAAIADLTDEEAPDSETAVFLTAWKRSDQCNHFWGPTVGQERFCTKCQLPQSAASTTAAAGPPRRRS